MKPEEYQTMFEVEDSLWWYRGMEAITRKVLARYYRRGQGLRILDAGCGTGATMKYLFDYGVVYGLDFSSAALEFSRRRGLTRLAAGSVTDLPFPDEVFDLVTSFDVLCVHGIDDRKALAEFRRVLAPGGRVVLRLPAYGWLRGSHDRAVDIAHRYKASELRRKLSDAGLQPEHTSYANTLLFPLAVLRRWTDRFFLRTDGSDLMLGFGPLDRIFRGILAAEAPWVAGRRLPFGLTIIAVGCKAVT